jgi:carboxyl-terminal processing protease
MNCCFGTLKELIAGGLILGMATGMLVGGTMLEPPAGSSAPSNAGAVAGSPDAASGSKDAERASAARPAPSSAIDVDVRLQSFDQVWTTVRDKHWDPSLGGLNWEGVREELRPRAEQAATAELLDAVLNEMLGRLKQSHFGIIPQSAYQGLKSTAADASSEDASDSSKREPGTIGVEFRWVDGQVIAWRVDEDGIAARSGVRPGWVLVERHGQEIEKVLNEAVASGRALVDAEFLKKLLVSHLGEGFVGKTESFVWLDGQGQRHELELVPQVPPGTVAKFGNLPSTYVQSESRVLDGNIPMFRLSIFFDPPSVLPQFEKLISEHRDAPGLILDLRGNPGGLGFMAMSFGGWLTDRQGLTLGTMITRSGSIKFTLLPREKGFRGKVAVLVDEFSMSTSEILAGGLQDLGLARVFGRKTPGMALPSAIERLPHGAGFQYAFANYQSADGKPLEGLGVEPDEPVAIDRETLLAGNDADIDAAVRWIRGASGDKPAK